MLICIIVLQQFSVITYMGWLLSLFGFLRTLGYSGVVYFISGVTFWSHRNSDKALKVNSRLDFLPVRQLTVSGL